MKYPESFNLTEISNWSQNRTVVLPTVQRGFVWRPYQIENLWDSLLRGYPIGSFVLSKHQACENDNSAIDLLDGQQRATAICLGFGTETFRNSKDSFKVFIDLEYPGQDDPRKYIFRVITKSHPWGYQKTDNSKPLESENIRKSLDLYGIEDHLNVKLDRFFPFDSVFPIPLELLLHSSINGDANQSIHKAILEWKLYKKIKANWNAKISTEGKVKFALNSEELLKDRIDEIISAIKQMLNQRTGQRLPAVYLNLPAIVRKSNEVNSVVNIDTSNGDTEGVDEVENLFIRMNAGGTPLRGEELNYSILKSHIDRSLQDNIEKTCKDLFNPANFISIAYRLFKNQEQTSTAQSITLRVKPKQFQKSINTESEISAFRQFLVVILNRKKYDGKNLITYIRNTLEYNSLQNSVGLPHLITSRLSDAAPEVMLMLMYRIQVRGDRFTAGDDIHRRMIGIISLFSWFGRTQKQKDHQKLLANIWPCALTLPKDQFWSSSTVQRAMLNNILCILPSVSQLDEFTDKINKLKIRTNTNIWGQLFRHNKLEEFFNEVLYKKEILLYAQRESLSDWFSDHQFHLDDTNVPFDWDHISPHKLLHNKKNISQDIKYWYHTNGNLRAWPYSLNRTDQDSSPARKLNPLNNNDFKNDKAGENKSKIAETKLIDFIEKKFKKTLSAKQVSIQFRKWSFNVDDWVNCDLRNLKDDRNAVTQLIKLIILRNIAICREWYDSLLIESLIPKHENPNFLQVIDERKWTLNPSEFKESFDFDEVDYWVISANNIIEGLDAHLYFGCPKSINNEISNVLSVDSIEFGILEDISSGNLGKIKISEKLESRYEFGTDEDFAWIQGYFTLISFDEASYVRLFSDFQNWLINFPNKEMPKLAEFFTTCLVKKFQRQISLN